MTQNTQPDPTMTGSTQTQSNAQIDSMAPEGEEEPTGLEAAPAEEVPMEIDEINMSQQTNVPEYIYDRPYMGTPRYRKVVAPTVPCATNLNEIFEEYKKFAMIKKKDDMNTNCPPGTEAYLVSKKWLDRYYYFILYS